MNRQTMKVTKMEKELMLMKLISMVLHTSSHAMEKSTMGIPNKLERSQMMQTKMLSLAQIGCGNYTIKSK